MASKSLKLQLAGFLEDVSKNALSNIDLSGIKMPKIETSNEIGEDTKKLLVVLAAVVGLWSLVKILGRVKIF